MKTLNFKKLTVSALAIAMGAGLAGAISGTFAWYQYSTRSTVAMLGTSVGTQGNLQVKASRTVGTTAYATDFLNDINTTQMHKSQADKGLGAFNLEPVTSGAATKNAAVSTFYRNPRYLDFAYANWRQAVANEHYVQFHLDFQVSKIVDGAAPAVSTPTNVFLTDVTIRGAGTEAADNETGTILDMSKAVRVLLKSDSNYALISKAGGTINVNGKLDLNGDDLADDSRILYEWDSVTGERGEIYGAEGATQEAYAYNDSAIKAAQGSQGAFSGGFAITPASGVDVTIWLEGWQELDSNTNDTYKSIWDTIWMGQQFNVGLAFAVNEL